MLKNKLLCRNQLYISYHLDREIAGFPPKYPGAGFERTISDMGASLVRAHIVSVFVKTVEEILLYILYRTFFSCHLSCATGQTVRSQNIKYYGIPDFFRQKNVTSLTSRPNLEQSHVKSRPTDIPL